MSMTLTTSAETSFCFSLPCSLSNSRLLLTPFSLSEHAAVFVNGTKHQPDLFQYRSHGPWQTVAEFEAFYNARIGSSATDACFAVIVKGEGRQHLRSTEEEDDGDANKSVDGVFAGVIGLENASVKDRSVEIGFITILPGYHRTFVARNAVGLLLQYVLDASPPGLGLRRCQWQCHTKNEASKKLAVKMGFVLEGVRRFERVMPSGRRGNGFQFCEDGAAKGAGQLGESRDSAVFAICCDEWERKRRAVLGVMERR